MCLEYVAPTMAPSRNKSSVTFQKCKVSTKKKKKVFSEQKQKKNRRKRKKQ